MLGIFLMWFVGFLLVVIIGAAAGGSDEVSLKDNTILKLELEEPIKERSKENPFGDLELPGMQNEAAIGLDELKKALKAAAADPKIKGIYLPLSSVQAGMSTMDEVRKAVVDFKKSKKFVIAYSEAMSEGAYYLASAADQIYLNPVGEVEFNGLSSTVPFLKGAFDKLGIEPEIFKVGDYKSAVEPFFRTDMSDASREQTTSFLNSIYNYMLGNIAQSRGLEVSYLKAVSDSMKVQSAEEALSYKLVTNLGYYDEVQAELRKKAGLKTDDKIEFVGLSKYLKSIKKEDGNKDSRIAVIVASGEIQGAKADDDNIGSDEIAEQIRKARLDKKIKAIVLRVNSPGGSALASDVMWREVQLCHTDKEHHKPIVASMSDLAASGGYYISMGCDSIVASPVSITGSIGVFGLLFNAKDMFNDKLGITFDNVSTGKFSDVGSATRPLSDYEKRSIQRSVEKIYGDFTSKAAAGRRMNVDDLRKVASGRVWSGLEAKERGLVDKLGTFEDAVSLAARMAKLKEGEYSLKYLPSQKSFFEKLMSSISGDDKETRVLKASLGKLYPLVKSLKQLQNTEGVQARLPFDVSFE